MRIEAAARIVVTARRVALLVEDDLLDGAGPEGAILTIAQRWDAGAMTASEFSETLETAEIVAILAEVPNWADAVWAAQNRVTEGEKSRLLHRM